MFVKSVNMKVKGILGLHRFGTELTCVYKRVGKVNSFDMVQQVVLLSIRLSTEGTSEHCTRTHLTAGNIAHNVFLQHTPVISWTVGEVRDSNKKDPLCLRLSLSEPGKRLSIFLKCTDVCTETWKASILFRVLGRWEEQAWEERALEGWERWGRGFRADWGRSKAVAAAACGLCARELTAHSWSSVSWHSRDSCIGRSSESGSLQCGSAGCSSGRPSFHRECTGKPHWSPFRCPPPLERWISSRHSCHFLNRFHH